jgi:hypothetical protein
MRSLFLLHSVEGMVGKRKEIINIPADTEKKTCPFLNFDQVYIFHMIAKSYAEMLNSN